MAEAAENVTPVNRMKERQTMIRGRIDTVRSFNDRDGKVFAHAITCPNDDPYSMPEVVEIYARSRLGGKGDEWRGLCNVGGFPRKPFQYTDRETGELVTVRPIEVRLWAVE